MKNYTLKDFQKDLKKYTADDVQKMRKSLPRRSFWLFGLDTPFKMILPEEVAPFVALGEYCGSRATSKPHAVAVDCGYFAQWDRPYFSASALDAVFVREFSECEQIAFNNAGKEWRTFSAQNEGFLLHEDYTNDLRKMADNFLYGYYEIVINGEDVADEEEKNAWRWACDFAGLGYIQKAKKDNAEKLAKARKFCATVAAMFNNSLHFNVEILSHGKPRDCYERAAFEMWDKLGAYNELTPDRLKSLVKWCNEKFSCKYGNGNSNNKSRDFAFSFGRESSPVVYLTFPADNEAHAAALFEQLRIVAHADEMDIIKISPSWRGVRVVARFWWD
nr:MAG TPA: hypothetical protein [Bacteriophage sp.]